MLPEAFCTLDCGQAATTAWPHQVLPETPARSAAAQPHELLTAHERQVYILRLAYRATAPASACQVKRKRTHSTK